jgi:hypothetical protein
VRVLHSKGRPLQNLTPHRNIRHVGVFAILPVCPLQAQVEGGGTAQDAARDSAERTLAALTEQNQRLSGEKAAAEAQARNAAVSALLGTASSAGLDDVSITLRQSTGC